MTIGTSLLLIAAGAILRYAVTVHTSGVDLATVGLVLILVGIAGLVLSLLWLGVWSQRRDRAVVERDIVHDRGPR